MGFSLLNLPFKMNEGSRIFPIPKIAHRAIYSELNVVEGHQKVFVRFYLNCHNYNFFIHSLVTRQLLTTFWLQSESDENEKSGNRPRTYDCCWQTLFLCDKEM